MNQKLFRADSTDADRAAKLAALAKHTAAPGAAITIAQMFFAKQADILASRYNTQREAEELATLNSATSVDLETATVAAEAVEDTAHAANLEKMAAERQARTTERRTLADIIDVTQLRTSEDPAEIVSLCEDAQAASDEVGEAARAIGIARLRKLAGTKEARQHLTPPSLGALCRLSVIQAQRAGTSHADTEARHVAKKKAIRSAVAAVAELCGLGTEFKRAPVAATISTAPKGSGGIVVGPYWEKRAQQR